MHSRTSPVGRRGLLLVYFLLGAVFFISLLAVIFHSSSLHANRVSFRYEKSEMIRQLAETALDEAFCIISQGCTIRESPFHEFVVSGSVVGRAIEIPIRQAEKIFTRSDWVPKAKVIAVVRRFTNECPSGAVLYGKEGFGTLELKGNFELLQTGSDRAVASCEMIRFHGYRVVSLVSARKNGNSGTRDPAQNSLLDYVLMVRNGRREFIETDGKSLNNREKTFRVIQPTDQNKLGKIFFGGTIGECNYIFLNLSETYKEWLPMREEYDHALGRLGVDCPPRHPLSGSSYEFEKFWNQRPVSVLNTAGHLGNVPISVCGSRESGELGEAEDLVAETVKNDSFNDPWGPKQRLRGPHSETHPWEAQCWGNHGPVQFGEALLKNVDPPLELIDPRYASNKEMARNIFEGNLRQRFIYYVSLFFPPESTLGRSNRIYPVVPANSSTTLIIRAIAAKMEEIRKQPENTSGIAGLVNPNMVSRFFYEYCMVPGIWFFVGDGSNASSSRNISHQYAVMEPFLHDERNFPVVPDGEENLRRIKSFGIKEMWNCASPSVRFENSGLFRKGVLELRGIHFFDQDIVLGSPPLATNDSFVPVRGRGVLIARSFRIDQPLRKFDRSDNNDLCVLYAFQGNIVVSTPERIEAVLISLNDNLQGHVFAKEKLDLFGSLIVDRLRTELLPTGKANSVEYDPLLKHISSDDDIYHADLFPWVAYQSISESGSP